MNKFSKYRSYLYNSDFRKIFFNIANFSLFQLTNYLVPLITIPYIVRVIGAGKFGIISFVQAVIYYFLIIVDYGFDISATQKVAQNLKSREKLNEIFSTVFVIKLLLMFLSLLVLICSFLLFEKVREYYIIYIFFFLMIPAQSMLSVWFFTGMEEMKYLNYTNVISKLGYLIGILVLISKPEDYYLIPAISSTAMLIAGGFAFWFMFYRFKIRFIIPSLNSIYDALKDGWHVFVSNISINLYRNSNIFILGLLAPDSIVGIYSAGEKIVKIIQSIFTPITRVLYPYISRKKIEAPEKSIKIIKKMVIFIGISTGVIFLFIITFSESITLLIFGEEFRQSINVIRICSIAILFGPVNYIIGVIFMLNFNLKSEFTKSVLMAGMVSIVSCYILSYYFYEIGTSIVFVSTEIFLMISYFTYIFLKQDKWRVFNAE
jgi:polysaccharide transporter, PST family